MPTYEYRCTDCGEHLEVVQSFSEKPLTECPNCKGQLRKVYSPVGIVLKGSGFYRTDSRSGGKGGSSTPKEKEKEKETSTSSSASSSSSSSDASSTPSKTDSKIA
jgi:putative FmdB family regulatory protein